MIEVRCCAGCGVRPVPIDGDTNCDNCRRRGECTARPCRHCGAIDGYQAGGRCSACKQFAAVEACSCRDCLAWGAVRTHKWLCRACIGWRISYPAIGPCAVCRTDAHLGRGGFCRLCWRTGSDAREATKRLRPYPPLDVVAANRNGQQLFFADMVRTSRRRPAAAPSVAPGPSPPRRRVWSSLPRQLSFFDPPRTWTQRHGIPDPPAAILAGLDSRARDLAATHGWSATQTKRVRLGLRVVLGLQGTPRGPVRASSVIALPHLGLRGQVAMLLTVLADAGMLDDDRVPAVEAWFDRETAGLPPAIVKELGVWFDIQRHGSARAPRCRPRQEPTTRMYAMNFLPVVRAWAAAGHLSLREISMDDVLAAMPAASNNRAKVARGLRSLFKTLKARGLVFVNPAAGLPSGRPERRQPLPLDVDALRAGLDSDDPVRAALTALFAFHGLKSGELCRLQLTDMTGGRLVVAGRRIVLAEPVRIRLGAYLDYRNAKWPASANGHLFINHRSACHTAPVGKRWLTIKLGMASRLIRDDRILDEALATGGDLRRICDLFGIGIEAATRYAVPEPTRGS